MTPTISFTFPINATFQEIIDALEEHFDGQDSITGENGMALADSPDVGQRNAAVALSQNSGIQQSQPAATFTAQPQVQQTAAAGAVDLDADGIPWDKRIHSSTGKKTASGIWTRRKNVPDANFKKVYDELINARGAAAPASQPLATISANGSVTTAPNVVHQNAPMTPEQMVAAHAASVGIAQQTQQPYTPPQNLPGQAVQQQAAPQFDANSYPGFAVFINNAIRSGRISQEQVNDTIKQAGVVDASGNGSLGAVGSAHHMIPAIYQLLDAFYQLRNA